MEFSYLFFEYANSQSTDKASTFCLNIYPVLGLKITGKYSHMLCKFSAQWSWNWVEVMNRYEFYALGCCNALNIQSEKQANACRCFPVSFDLIRFIIWIIRVRKL